MSNKRTWQEEGRQNNPFKVPDGYFEGFENRILEQVKKDQLVQKNRFLKPSLVRWISGVAAILLIGFVGFQQFHLKPQKVELDQVAMYAVLEYYAQDLDETTFASLLAENDVLSYEEENSETDFLDYMDVDDLEIIEAILNSK